MDAIEALLTRRTVPPVKITDPGPDEAQLRRILEAGLAAPDHGKLRPWRFLVVEGEARARLGELFGAALAAEHPDWSAAEIAKHRDGPTRAPSILIVAAKVRPDVEKVPVVEQIASAAAAAQNMALAAHAQGLAVKWATGKPAYSPGVKRGLGLGPDDVIVAILYIGAYGTDHPAPPRPGPEGLVQRWEGPPG